MGLVEDVREDPRELAKHPRLVAGTVLGVAVAVLGTLGILTADHPGGVALAVLEVLGMIGGLVLGLYLFMVLVMGEWHP